jgi:hypothetical protein
LHLKFNFKLSKAKTLNISLHKFCQILVICICYFQQYCSYIVVATIGGGNKAVSTKSGQVLGKQLTPGTSQAKVHRELDLKTYLIVEKKVFFKIMICCLNN